MSLGASKSWLSQPKAFASIIKGTPIEKHGTPMVCLQILLFEWFIALPGVIPVVVSCNEHPSLESEFVQSASITITNVIESLSTNALTISKVSIPVWYCTFGHIFLNFVSKKSWLLQTCTPNLSANISGFPRPTS